MSYYPYAPSPYYPVALPVPVVQYDPPRLTSEEGPAPEKPRGLWPTRYARVLGAVMIAVTVAAIALAAIAPSLAGVSSLPVPSGWTKFYDGKPEAGGWSNAAGCDFGDAGLHITGSTATGNCPFLPSRNRDLVSGGFYVEATLGSAAQLSATEDGGILVGRGSEAIIAIVDQSGAYRLCTPPCTSDASVYASGDTVAWHANGYTDNVVGLRYLADSHTATLYVNGQPVRSVTYTLPTQSEIALGASRGAEAIFTHVAVYASAG